MSRESAYELLIEQLESLITPNWVSNLSNASALLWSHFKSQPSPQKDVNWAGFYLTNKLTNSLELGPFQGKVACQVIAFGRGVCGTSASTKSTLVVKDVHTFEGHIACDAESESEIVVPIINNTNEVVGVLDIDCKSKNGFDQLDAKYLEIFVSKLGNIG